MTSERVLVVGASRGIGRAIALRLGADGYQVTVHYREQEEQARQVQAEIITAGGTAGLVRFDVTDREAVHKVLAQDCEENGAYYGVVLSAGIARDNAFPALTADDWDAVLRTNLDGFYNVLNPVIMPMIKRRKPGRIITLSSVSGLMGNRGQVNYSAAKAGIIGATKALATELAKRKITVNCIAPGLIASDMLTDTVIEEAMPSIPMRRVGQPEEVAALVSFLMSPEAAYITRQVISVNGGMV